MKLRYFFLLIVLLLNILATSPEAYADVGSVLIWDGTTTEHLTINKGQSAGFLAIFESLGERAVNVKVELLRNGVVVPPALLEITNLPGDYHAYQLFIRPRHYANGGEYIVRATITGLTTRIMRTTQLSLIVVNHAPQVPENPISRGGAEGELLTFNIDATDADGDTLTYTVTSLPRGARLDSTGRFSWVPDYTQSGAYEFAVTVSDSERASTRILVFINVRDNPTPIVSITPDNPGTLDSLTCSITPNLNGVQHRWTRDGVEVAASSVLGAALTKKGQTFICNVYRDFGNPIGVFQYGNDQVTIQNTIPAINPIPDETLNVGMRYFRTVTGIYNGSLDADIADGTDSLTYGGEVVPVDPAAPLLQVLFTNIGTIDFTPQPPNGGYTYILRPYAIDRENARGSTEFRITVARLPNQYPTITVPDFTVEEGQTLTIELSNYARDPEGDALTYGARYLHFPLPPGATIDPVSGRFTWTPNYEQAGRYEITFTINDGPGRSNAEDVSIIAVTNKNRAPFFSPPLEENVRISEGRELTFAVAAVDPDGDRVALSAENLPVGATFNVNTGIFTWTPGEGAAADSPYTVTFIASDGVIDGTTRDQVAITVSMINNPPVLTLIGNKTVEEGRVLSFVVTATDPDDDSLRFRIKDHTLPGANPSLDARTGEFNWGAGYIDAGTYTIIFEVSDGEYTDEETITVNVININRAPVLAPIGDKTVAEGQDLEFQVTAIDPDSDSIRFLVTNLPAGAIFNEWIGKFEWMPSFDQSGTYELIFVATDGSLRDTERITINVTNTNRAPIFEQVLPQTVSEGETLTFTATATDPDGDELQYGASNLPQGASFDPVTRTLTWTPSFEQKGAYTVTFTVTDAQFQDNMGVSILVENTNRPPIITPLADRITLNEGERLAFSFKYKDLDPEDQLYLFYKAGGITPEQFNAAIRVVTSNWNNNFFRFFFNFRGINLDPHTAKVIIAPNFDFVQHPNRVEEFQLTFIVSDRPDLQDPEAQTAEQVVDVTVNDVNRFPILQNPGNKQVRTTNELTFTLVATDADDDALTYEAQGLPEGAQFDVQTGEFAWTPEITQARTYSVTFIVEDGLGGSAQRIIIITVSDSGSNGAPELNTIGNKEISVTRQLQFTISATDPENDPLTYSASGLPERAIFDATTRTFTWTPNFDQSGQYQLTFTVSDGVLSDMETITITVVGGGDVNGAPVITSKPVDITPAGAEYNYQLHVTDPDQDNLTYTLIQGPEGMTINANGVVHWTPERKGRYPVKITVTDGELSIYQYYTITVRELTDEGIKIASAHITPEVAHAGETAVLHIVMNNNGGKDLEDLQLSVIIPELGFKRSAGLVDLDAGEKASRNFAFELPEYLEPGEYVAKITVSNGLFQESAYRAILLE